ncbi:MAG: TIM barrel protein [Rhodothermales bacterium]|nr:TIM barrel protein [Rhodothermales bacterium]
MKTLNRREFLGTTTAGVLAAGAAVGHAAKGHPVPAKTSPAFGRPISFQSYGMRKEIEVDFQGTLRSVKALGYDGVEMCSPLSYDKAGFGNLTPLKPEDIKKQIEDTGLFCHTSHFQAREILEKDPAETADYAARMGLSDIIMSGSGINDQGTADDFMRWGEKCNKAAVAVQAAGLRLGYHNHAVGPMVSGKPQYEHIMEALDPDMVTMQFQLASIVGGYDIVYYLEKYAGRYSSLHMHDYDPKMKAERPGRIGSIVPCGEGMIDWSALLKAAMKSPITDHGFIVEIETSEPLDGLKRSIAYLKSVQV